MSENIYQVFLANPITTNAATDLMYFGQSPYGAGDDAAMTFSNFAAQFGGPFTPSALTINDDTNVTLTLGGTPATALLEAASITAGWTGTLSGARGGTGVANTGLTINLGSATTGYVLTSDSSGNATWQSVSASGGITTIGGDSGSATPLTGVVTISGAFTGLTFAGAAHTLSLGGTLALTNGGTNNTLTASAGGIVWSDATRLHILPGTATAHQLLLSGSSAIPVWSQTTYPTTNAINTLLYASSANTMAALATANNGVLITNNTGVPSWLANSGTPGFVLTANSGAPPSWQSITAEGAITTINGDAGSITPTAGAVTISGGTTGLTTTGSASTMDLTGTLNVGHGGLGITTTPSNGQIPIGNATNYTAATLTPGTGISITNGSGSITIASNGANPWVDETGSSVTMTANTGYTSDDGAS